MLAVDVLRSFRSPDSCLALRDSGKIAEFSQDLGGGRGQGGRMSVGRETPSLSPHRAFVVEFSGEDTTSGRPLSGRVEHVVSGRATRFTSAAELLAFVELVLRSPTPAHKRRSDP
jgi:hypothetical protein